MPELRDWLIRRAREGWATRRGSALESTGEGRGRSAPRVCFKAAESFPELKLPIVYFAKVFLGRRI